MVGANLFKPEPMYQWDAVKQKDPTAQRHTSKHHAVGFIWQQFA